MHVIGHPEKPYLPDVRTEHHLVKPFNLFKQIVLKIKHTTVLRLKTDGKYFDVECSQLHDIDIYPTIKDLTSYVAENVLMSSKAFMGQVYQTQQLYITDDLKPSEYQMDEEKRLKNIATGNF